MEQNLVKIKEIIEKLLQVMDFSGEVNIASEENLIRANIQSPEASYLIGRSGDNLKALQQVARAIVGKQLLEQAHFIIDVNDYQKSRLELLKEIAKKMAQEAKERHEPKWLAPMNAYERRIVHLTLAVEPGIKTESEGEGEERRIVIKPT